MRAVAVGLGLLLSVLTSTWAEDRNPGSVSPADKSQQLPGAGVPADTLQRRFQRYLTSPANRQRDKAAKLVDLSRITLQADSSSGRLSDGSIRIHYEVLPGVRDSAAVEELVTAMVVAFVNQDVADKGTQYQVIDDGIKPQLQPRSREAQDAEIALTPETCFDLAYGCYIRGWYKDGVAWARRGAAARPDARLELVKGVCELHAGNVSEARATAAAYRTALSRGATFGLEIALERINDPMSVEFRDLASKGSPLRPATSN